MLNHENINQENIDESIYPYIEIKNDECQESTTQKSTTQKSTVKKSTTQKLNNINNINNIDFQGVQGYSSQSLGNQGTGKPSLSTKNAFLDKLYQESSRLNICNTQLETMMKQVNDTIDRKETRQQIINNGYFILYVWQTPIPESKSIDHSKYFYNYYDKYVYYTDIYGKFNYCKYTSNTLKNILIMLHLINLSPIYKKS